MFYNRIIIDFYLNQSSGIRVIEFVRNDVDLTMSGSGI